MKWDIQRKQREELADMPEDDRRRTQKERIAADPILGPYIEQVRRLATPKAASRR